MSILWYQPTAPAAPNEESVAAGREPVAPDQRGIVFLAGGQTQPLPFLLPNVPPVQTSYAYTTLFRRALVQAVYTGIWYRAATPSTTGGPSTLVQPATPRPKAVSGQTRAVPQYLKVARLKRPSRLPSFFTPKGQ